MNNLDTVPLVPSCGTRRRFLLVAVLLPIILVFSRLTADTRPDDKAACPKGETRTDDGCFKGPEIISKAQPIYPRPALRKRVKASVVVSVRVKTDGQAEEMKVISSSATDNAFLKDFEAAALAAVGKWRYRAGTLNGKPRDMYLEATVEFEASRSRPWYAGWFDFLS